MAKKTLQLVKTQPSTGVQQPPRKLDQAGMSLWRRVMLEFDIRDVGGLELLALACQSLDRAEDAAACLDRDGLMFVGKGNALRENPLAKIELSNRAFVARVISRLGLTVEPLKAMGRPTKPHTWEPD